MQQDERFLIATSSNRLALTVEPLPAGRGCNPAFFLNMVSSDLGLKRASLSATFWPVVAFCLDFLAIQRPTKPASACPPPPMVSRRISRDFFSSLPLLSCHSKQLSSRWSLRTGRGGGGEGDGVGNTVEHGLHCTELCTELCSHVIANRSRKEKQNATWSKHVQLVLKDARRMCNHQVIQCRQLAFIAGCSPSGQGWTATHHRLSLMVTASQQQHQALQHKPLIPLAPWPAPLGFWQLLHAALHSVQLKYQPPKHEARDIVKPSRASTGCQA